MEGGVTRYVNAKDLPQRDKTWLEQNETGWRPESKGTPTRFYLELATGEARLGLVPAPEIAVDDEGWLYVPCVLKPTDMTNSTDVPFTIGTDTSPWLEEFHQALVHFAASMLEPLRRNTAMADRQRQMFASYVADYFMKRRRHGPKHVQIGYDYRAAVQGARAGEEDEAKDFYR